MKSIAKEAPSVKPFLGSLCGMCFGSRTKSTRIIGEKSIPNGERNQFKVRLRLNFSALFGSHGKEVSTLSMSRSGIATPLRVEQISGAHFN